jgi:DNA-binding NarL/FixJ family response regulator
LKWGKADQVIKPPPQRLTIALSYSRCPRRTSNMPGMDGLQLLGEIKQRFPDLPVMMVTAYGDDARRRQATE